MYDAGRARIAIRLSNTAAENERTILVTLLSHLRLTRRRQMEERWVVEDMCQLFERAV